MPAMRRMLVALGVMVSLVFAGSAATAAPASARGYVKYYVVAAAYQGQPENLPEIAGRFLGSTARSGEIFELNAGVVQADGSKLNDPMTLHAGWVLTLPWDAVGPGVQYGLLPTPAPPPPAPAPAPAPPAQSNATPSKPAATNPNACAGAPAARGTQAEWAMHRLAPHHAWAHSRGGGVLVAVVDSGVDAAVPELAGHVTVGVDIVAGTGRGDTDCLGTGTAMAGIVAASSESSSGMHGMAPDAMVMPVRVAPTKAAVSESDQASAIEVAVSAGAKVIALGAYIDPSMPAVASAIEFAAGHDVVIIIGAPVQSAAATATAAASAPGPTRAAGLLRVGGIGIDGAMAAKYEPGMVDVVAPGINITGLGISGVGAVQASGTEYAVAFVAGQAALVRSMYPNLTAAQVVRRIQATADRMGSGVPDAMFGWGLINPGEAITRVIADENRGPDPADAAAGGGWSSLRTWALIIIILLALAMVLLLLLRIRRMVRVAPLAIPDPEAESRASVDGVMGSAGTRATRWADEQETKADSVGRTGHGCTGQRGNLGGLHRRDAARHRWGGMVGWRTRSQGRRSTSDRTWCRLVAPGP